MFRQELCETCLSSKRKMCFIDEDQLQTICPGFQISVQNNKVCWECHSMVHKWVQFRDRVVKAQELLADCTNTKNLKSLSKLCINKLDYVSIESTKDSQVKPEENDDKVKEELDYKYEVPITPLETPLEDPIGEMDLSTDIEQPETPIRVFVNEGVVEPKTKKIKPSNNPVKSCMKTKKETTKNITRKVKKKVVFNDVGSSETDTADEFQDEEEKKADNTKVQTFRIVRVEKNKLLKLMLRAKHKRWFNLSKHPKCPSCIILFKTEEGYRMHLKKHDESAGSFPCEICGQRFMTQHRANLHQEAHLNKCIECIECHELFASQWDFSAHYKDIHSQRDIMCWKCIKMFPTMKHYRQHRREVHCNVKCTCELCGKKLNASSLKVHMRIAHTQVERTECPLCFKMIKGNMKHVQRTHMKKVHGPTIPDENSFCVECNTQFRNIWSYRSHVRTKHDKEKTECPECGKWFTCIRSHMRSHSNEYKHSCSECNKKFKRHSTMMNHVKYVHRGVPKPRTKTCSVCLKSFSCNRQLSDHMNTHTGERPYVCSQCGDTFGHKAALFTHTRRKHAREKHSKEDIE